jgi:hypothetical protein
MLATITSEEKIPVTLAPLTAAGNPATVDGVPVWEVTSGDATLAVAADGLSAYLISGAADVVSSVTVTADADLGEGVTNLSEVVTLTVVAPSAALLGATAGAPELK